ncbi:MAG: 2,3-bisphosphoglycerate-independent phosphoglycerate mutase [Gammaproteobacteria bacterium]
MTTIPKKPIVLLILDGWGHRESIHHNAISAAKTPRWDDLWAHCPHTLISGSGPDVGLPNGQMGNSEVGHMNIGAGRVVFQDLTRIDQAIETGEFVKRLDQLVENTKPLHIMGLLSPGGVHSQERHLLALLHYAKEKGFKQVYIHAFLDGRDTPPRSALTSIHVIEQAGGRIASLIGRYYAMDRDKRWDRVQKAYDLLTRGTAAYEAETAEAGLRKAYERGETDEFVQATRIGPATNGAVIGPDDTVVFMNYRADRARELTHLFLEGGHRGKFITLTQYAADLPATVIFPPIVLKNMLGEYLSALGLRQLRMAETEKYAHVTFFFNGGVEAPAPGEDRCLVPSPPVATYDLQPEMSAPELTDKLGEAIRSKKYHFIVCNYANPDMVGHTGNFDAAVKAIEVIDECLRKVTSIVHSVGGEVIITADHGNAECMYDEMTHQPHTAHTCELVPFVYVGRKARITQEKGVLSDIAPTILYLMGLPQPVEMTGKSLLTLEKTV